MGQNEVKPWQHWVQTKEDPGGGRAGDLLLVLSSEAKMSWSGGGFASLLRFRQPIFSAEVQQCGSEHVSWEHLRRDCVQVVGGGISDFRATALKAPEPNRDTELLDFLSSACQRVDIEVRLPMEDDTYSVTLKPCAEGAVLNVRTAIENLRGIRNRYRS